MKSLGRQQQATLSCCGAGFRPLHLYTGQTTSLWDAISAGRTERTNHRCFINTVVLRAQFPSQTTFRSLLQQVRTRALAAYAHPDLPFEHLVAELAPERDASRTPLFQVMFVLHNTDGVSQVSKVSGNREFETGTSKSI